MTPAEIVQALHDGKIIDNHVGDQYKYEGITMYVKYADTNKWLPTTLSVAYILQFPNHFRVVGGETK